MTKPIPCVLCGHVGSDVQISLVNWKDDARPFDDIPRCVDRQACRDRVESAGESWPVRDTITVPYLPTETPVEPAPAEAAEEEVPSWL